MTTSLDPTEDIALAPVPWRAVTLLSLAAFASAASIRLADPLLPLIAAEFDTTTGEAARVIIAFSITYGLFQLVGGLAGDRFGKFLTASLATILSAGGALLCAIAVSLDMLVLARLAAGAAAAAIMPMALAWIGDAIDFAQRPTVLARFLPGQILGVIFGQAIGGILAEFMGWRAVFLVIALLQFLIGAAMLWEARKRGRAAEQINSEGLGPLQLLVRMAGLLREPWVRTVLLAVFLEGFAVFGAMAFMASHLQLNFGLNAGAAGLIMAAFGVGGMVFSLSSGRLIPRFGSVRLAQAGGIVLAVAFGLLAFDSAVWPVPLISGLLGFGFYLLHNTLQLSATQMAPEARGSAMAVYASCLFFGQTFGTSAAAVVFDRNGIAPVFLFAALLLPCLALWFSFRLEKQAANSAEKPESQIPAAELINK